MYTRHSFSYVTREQDKNFFAKKKRIFLFRARDARCQISVAVYLGDCWVSFYITLQFENVHFLLSCCGPPSGAYAIKLWQGSVGDIAIPDASAAESGDALSGLDDTLGHDQKKLLQHQRRGWSEVFVGFIIKSLKNNVKNMTLQKLFEFNLPFILFEISLLEKMTNSNW